MSAYQGRFTGRTAVVTGAATGSGAVAAAWATGARLPSTATSPKVDAAARPVARIREAPAG